MRYTGFSRSRFVSSGMYSPGAGTLYPGIFSSN